MAAGIEHEVVPADVDERVLPGEAAEAYVRRVAADKARAVAGGAAGRVVLAADTVVVVDEAILGKPCDAADAHRMLRLLSGRDHVVLTGVVVCRTEHEACRVAATRVSFAALTDEEIAWYVQTGEPGDKAGAYAIQGLASRFVTRIEGSYSNVVGLPIDMVYPMLRAAGLNARLYRPAPEFG